MLIERKDSTLNRGFRFCWMAVVNFIFSISGCKLNPCFRTTNIANCSGPPFGGAELIAAVSKILSSALLHTRSISTELVWWQKGKWKRTEILISLVRKSIWKKVKRGRDVFYLDPTQVHSVICSPLYNQKPSNSSFKNITMSP